MKLIHTADWHLGAQLHNQSREAEHRAFLNWLIDLLRDEKPDALIIAGDIFDTSTPSNSAQTLYYHFLLRASAFCTQIFIIAGNHDSAGFLEAPAAILQELNIQVIALPDIERSIFDIHDASGSIIAILAAVPYLRDRDIRLFNPNTNNQDKVLDWKKGVYAYYHALAEKIQMHPAAHLVPVITTGHLFVAGSRAVDVECHFRRGFIEQVGCDAFPNIFDYVALGHLHLAQTVATSPCTRYSGTPIPISFGEINYAHEISRVTFSNKQPIVSSIPVPCWQSLISLRGNRTELCTQLQSLVSQQADVWVEAIAEYSGVYDASLYADLQEICAGSSVKLLRLRNPRPPSPSLNFPQQELIDLTPEHVFSLRIAEETLDVAEKTALTQAFNEILHQLSDTPADT